MPIKISLEHIKRLEKIRALFAEHKKSIHRRKWSSAEKAASIADIQQDIDALDCALSVLAPIG